MAVSRNEDLQELLSMIPKKSEGNKYFWVDRELMTHLFLESDRRRDILKINEMLARHLETKRTKNLVDSVHGYYRTQMKDHSDALNELTSPKNKYEELVTKNLDSTDPFPNEDKIMKGFVQKSEDKPLITQKLEYLEKAIHYNEREIAKCKEFLNKNIPFTTDKYSKKWRPRLKKRLVLMLNKKSLGRSCEEGTQN